MASLMVHGGCGAVRSEFVPVRQRGAEEAVAEGKLVLRNKGSALDAVEAAVRCMEDNPAFNAGTGSVLTLYGEVEMDASIMTSTLDCGAVAAVRDVQYPITLARRVMELTDHVLLAGRGANLFARFLGVPAYDPRTQERIARWREVRDQIERGGPEALAAHELKQWARLSQYLEQYLTFEEHSMKSTVGAVACDDGGLMAAATSTGGIWFKLPGRVGDTPIIGAGTYASTHGAASATGDGEGIIKLCLTQRTVSYMEMMSAQEAATKAVEEAGRYGVECGVIAVDAQGNLGSAFKSAMMPTASVVSR